MPDPVERFLSDWHRFVAQRDPALLTPLLAEDVSLGAPPHWTKLQGREIVHHLLCLILQTIEGFSYQRQWRDGREIALEFTGRVGKLELQGIDLISLDEQQRVRSLDVLMRPRASIEALERVIAPQMMAFLAAQNEQAG